MVAIFVALMFVGLVLMDAVVQKIEARRAVSTALLPASRRARPAPVTARVGSFPWAVPQGVYLSEGHAWFKPDPSGQVRVGADALVAHALGTPEKVLVPKIGDLVSKGQPLFHLVHGRNNLALASSVTGRVVAINAEVQQHPELLARDPYGAGWVCNVVSSDLEARSPKMRLGGEVAAWLQSEFNRFCEFVSGNIPPDLALGSTSLDAGPPEVGALAQLDDAAWNAFEVEFLRTT